MKGPFVSRSPILNLSHQRPTENGITSRSLYLQVDFPSSAFDPALYTPSRLPRSHGPLSVSSHPHRAQQSLGFFEDMVIRIEGFRVLLVLDICGSVLGVVEERFTRG